jgi:hypothetical protein
MWTTVSTAHICFLIVCAPAIWRFSVPISFFADRRTVENAVARLYWIMVSKNDRLSLWSQYRNIFPFLPDNPHIWETALFYHRTKFRADSRGFPQFSPKGGSYPQLSESYPQGERPFMFRNGGGLACIWGEIRGEGGKGRYFRLHLFYV